MNSLNSQESSNDIVKLTDRQQAEYRSAYQDYIAQMAQLEVGGANSNRPIPPPPAHLVTSSEEKGKDEPDPQKLSTRGNGTKSSSETDSASNTDTLDPITEEDEKNDHGAPKSLLARKTSSERVGLFHGAAELKLKGGGGSGPRYQKLMSDDEESEESDHAPLLGDDKNGVESKPSGASLALKGKDYLSDAMLDKKDSSDSGVRSNESSPNHSLQDEEAELSQLDTSNLIQLEDGTGRKASIPSSLSGLQDPTLTRMSICSEDQCSLLASSPEESWPHSKTYNLNRTPSSVTLNNNSNNRPCQPAEGSTSSTADIIISSSGRNTSTGTAGAPSRPGPDNENVRVVHLKRNLKPGDPPEIVTVSSDTVTFGEEHESIL